MNAVSRILLMINVAFAIALLVSMVALVEQGREDVLREQQAMRPVVEALIESGKTREILTLVGDSLRHMQLQEDGKDIGSSRDDQPPEWFVRWLDHPERGYSLSLTESGGRSLTLVPDDSDEIAEVWDSARQLFWLFIGSALVSNLAIFLGVRAGIRPLEQILSALEQVQHGDFRARLGSYGIPEVNAIASHFNDMASELEKSERENRHLTQTLMQVQEQERASLARELHDGLGQQVTGIRAQGYLIPYQQPDSELLSATSQNIVTACDAIDQGFRRIIHNLYPVQLEQLGLRAAVSDMMTALEVQTGVVCQLDDCNSAWPDWSLDSATQVYRLLQEAMNNAVRHADATRIWVLLETTATGYQLSVHDNGRGFSPMAGSGFGIRSMRERCLALGGRLDVRKSDRGGVEIRAALPSPFES